MVLLVHVFNKNDYDIAMPPFHITIDEKEYKFPPRLRYPIESYIPFDEHDYEIIAEGVLEKRSEWLGKWRPRYCVLMRYKVTYRHLMLNNMEEKTKNYYYLYYWKNTIEKQLLKVLCAPEIIYLSSCVSLDTKDIHLPSGHLSPNNPPREFHLVIRKYERPTQMYYFHEPCTSYYLRCHNEYDYERWTMFLRALVSYHSYKLERRKLKSMGNFMTIESRRIVTSIIDGHAAHSFPMGFGYSTIEQEKVIS